MSYLFIRMYSSLAVLVFLVLCEWLLLGFDLSFESLHYIQGKVGDLKVKEKRKGIFVTVVSDIDGSKVILNIGNDTAEVNQRIRNFKKGAKIKAWYSNRIPMKYNSVALWQLEYEGVTLIDFDKTSREINFIKYFIRFIGLIVAVCVFVFYKNQK